MATYYICRNPECSKLDKEQLFGSVNHKWNEEKKCFFPEEKECVECKGPTEIKQVDNTVIPEVSINTFSSMSDQDKRKMLIKRTKVHEKSTHVEELIDHKRKAITKNYFGE